MKHTNPYQLRFFNEWQLSPSSKAYYLSHTFEIKGQLEITRFTEAVQQVIAAVKPLHILFNEEGEAQEQPPNTSLLRVREDFNSLEAVFDFLGQIKLRPCSGPLFEINLFTLNQECNIFSVLVHHILLDGVSLKKLFELIELAYNTPDQLQAALANLSFPTLPVMSGSAQKEALVHLTSALKNGPALMDLPNNGEVCDLSKAVLLHSKLPSSLTKSLFETAASYQVSLFELIASCFSILLHHYCPTQNQTVVKYSLNMSPDFQRAFGCFVNNQLLQTSFVEGLTFKALLKQIQAQRQCHREHGGLPYNQLVRHLVSEGKIHPGKVHNVSFDQRPLYYERFSLNGLEVNYLAQTKNECINPLHFSYDVHNGEIITELHVASDIFSTAQSLAFLEHYECLLKHVVQEVDFEINQLSIFSDTSQKHYLQSMQGTALKIKETSLLECIDFDKYAKRVAVSDDADQLTYGELGRLSASLGAYLQSKGLGKGDVVALFAERGVHLSVMILAVLRIGAAYLPIDTASPTERIRFILEDSSAKQLLSHRSLAGLVSEHALDALWYESAEHFADSFESPQINQHDLAYVIYTSGSTGQPKGVPIEHGAILNRLQWQQSVFKADEHDAILQKTPYSFDVSVWELLWPLMVGAKLHYAKAGGHADPVYLRECIRFQGVTICHFVPSMLTLFLEALAAENNSLPLRLVVCSGEALMPEQVHRFYRRLPNVALYNLYGPTEAAIDVTYFDCQTLKQSDYFVPIGKPIDNVTLRVVNPYGHCVPPNVPGELCIGGIALTPGYLNRADQNKASFFECPVSKSRFYRTGDQVIYRENGPFIYLSRLDFQVKINGLRVELGEIEALIHAERAVKQAVVMLSDQNQLLAFVSLNQNEHFDLEALKLKMAAHLPSYMLPTQWLIRDALTLSANGKVDRKALLASYSEQPASDGNVAPLTEQAKNVASIWESVLGVPVNNMAADFFRLGGHSILAIRLAMRLSDTFQKKVVLNDIYQHTTLQSQCEFLANSKALKTISTFVDPSQNVAATRQQSRLWLLENLGESVSAYFINRLYRLKQVDIGALEASLKSVVARHPILTSSLDVEGGVLTNRLFRNVINFERVNIDSVSDEGLIQVAKSIGHQKINIGEQPLFRAQLLYHNEELLACLFHFHHIIFDGASWDVFVRDFEQYYVAHQNAREVEVQPECAYLSYAQYQRTVDYRASLTAELDYWLSKLGQDAEPLNLPYDRPRPSAPTYRGKTHRYELNATLSERLSKYANESDCSIFALFNAALNSLLYRYTSQADISVGTVVENRDLLAYEDAIGFFANTIVLKNTLSANQSFKNILANTADTLAAALQHHRVPFDWVVEKLGLSGESAVNPLFQVALVWQGEMQKNTAFGELVAYLPDVAKFDLALFVHDAKGHYELDVEYATDLFLPETMDRFFQHWLAMLEAMLTDDTQTIGNFNYLGKAELNELDRFNQTALDIDSQQLLHEPFLRQAQKTPDAIAIFTESLELSYGELDQKANQLANTLLCRAYPAQSCIAIFLPKGPAQVVASIAVLKSGLVFLPLSYDEPLARVDAILKQAGADTLIIPGLGVEICQNELTSHYHFIAYDEAMQNGDVRPPSPQHVMKPNDLAYVIFTSGSTGLPKGVMIEHQSALNTLLDINQRFEVVPEDRIFALSAFNFDLSIYDIFGILAAGAAMVLPAPGESKDPSTWLKYFKRFSISLWDSVPALMQLMVDYCEREKMSPLSDTYLQSLRVVLLSGDWIGLNLPEQIQSYFGADTRVISLGGATEGSVWSIHYPIEQVRTDWRSIPYGKPLANQSFHVFNDQLMPCPIGVMGDLYIGGIGVARGYLNDDQKTAAAFITHPKTGHKLYRTGDMGRYLPDGNIEFCGRSDFQVKIRGFRIELGEIAQVLIAISAIDKAVVIPHGKGNDAILVAFVTLNESMSESQIQQVLSERLPSYMLPQSIVILDKMPLTANGKIDRKTLVQVYEQMDHKPESLTMEQMHLTPAQMRLFDIWSNLLETNHIALDSNFFSLGGHSLLITHLAWAIEDAFSVKVSMPALFRHSQFDEQAAYLDELAKVNPIMEGTL